VLSSITNHTTLICDLITSKTKRDATTKMINLCAQFLKENNGMLFTDFGREK
jgi:hypothetical protein